MKVQKLRRLVEAQGWVFVRHAASHHLYHHPTLPGVLSVPQLSGGKEVKPGLAKKILIEAKRGVRNAPLRDDVA